MNDNTKRFIVIIGALVIGPVVGWAVAASGVL